MNQIIGTKIDMQVMPAIAMIATQIVPHILRLAILVLAIRGLAIPPPTITIAATDMTTKTPITMTSSGTLATALTEVNSNDDEIRVRLWHQLV